MVSRFITRPVDMSDLIDLDTVHLKAEKKLVDPLIPVPRNSPQENPNTSNECSSEDNPFDQVLRETARNLRKLQDPFEAIVMEAAESSEKDSPNFVKRVEELSDSFSKWVLHTPERSAIDIPEIKLHESSPNKLCLDISPIRAHDSSILSESAMNDTLSDEVFSEIGAGDKNCSPISPTVKMRSYSQPDNHLPNPAPNHRWKSLLNMGTKASGDISSSSSMASIFFEDPFNKGFRKSSSLSGISAVSRGSSNFSINSYGSLNKAFCYDSSCWEELLGPEDEGDASNDAAFVSFILSFETKLWCAIFHYPDNMHDYYGKIMP